MVAEKLHYALSVKCNINVIKFAFYKACSYAESGPWALFDGTQCSNSLSNSGL